MNSIIGGKEIIGHHMDDLFRLVDELSGQLPDEQLAGEIAPKGSSEVEQVGGRTHASKRLLECETDRRRVVSARG